MRPHADLLVVGGALVRVLAIGEVQHLLEGGDVLVREVVLALGEPARDRRVVARGGAERLRGQRLAGLGGERAAGLRQLLDHRVIALGPHHNADVRVVLGRRSDQRGTAHVDVLDDLLLRDAAARGRALERIQVHDHQVDRRDAVLGERQPVLLARAHRQQPGEDRRMQGLDAPVEDLGKAGVVLDRPRLDAVLGQLGRRAAGRDDLDAQLCQGASEVDHSTLVENGEEGPLDPQIPRHRLGLDRAACLWISHRRPGPLRPHGPTGGAARPR
jgi:hypothetical protein